MKKLISALLVAGLFSASSLFAGQYVIDPAHSYVGFKIKHMKISNVKGSFSDYKSVIEFNEDKKQPTKIESVIKVTSVDTGIEKRDNHLRTADFFDVEKFPEMRFVMKEFKGDKIVGDLTIKGVTKPVVLDYDFGGITKNKEGKNLIGFSLEGEIKRSEFGIGEESAMVGDEVKLQIEVEAPAK